MHTNTPTGSTPDPAPENPSHSTGPAATPPRRRLGAVAGAGLLAGLIAAAIGGVAGAQTAGTTVLTEVDQPAAQVRVMEVIEGDDGEFEDFEISAEDEAVWEQFDQCLVDAGVDFEALDAAEESGDESALDFEALDAAFESCDPILEGLSEDFEMFEISAEDEAVWEQFDQCLVDNGVDFEAFEAVEVDEGEEASDGDVMVEVFEGDDETLDAAFEACDPILENLSEDFEDDMFEVELGDGDGEMFDISAEDEAVFEQFDQCLVDAGVDFEALDAAEESGDESALDFEALDAAFESCDPILEGLSDDFEIFEMELDEDEADEDEDEDEADDEDDDES